MGLTFLISPQKNVQPLTKVGTPSFYKEPTVGASSTSTNAGQVEFMMLMFLLTQAFIRRTKWNLLPDWKEQIDGSDVPLVLGW